MMTGRSARKLWAIVVIGSAAGVYVPMARSAPPAAALPQPLPPRVARFPLSKDAIDDAHRIQSLEQLRTQFPPEKSERSHIPMRTLFELYVRTDPQKAVKLAQQMQATGAAKSWRGRVELAEALIEVNQKLHAGRAREALALVSRLTPDKYYMWPTPGQLGFENGALIDRVRARVMAEVGQAQTAFRTLLQLEAKAPEDETEAELQEIGKLLHKGPARVEADVKATLYAGAKPAPPFDLQEYSSNEGVSLAKLRGKVVLLTFWFPSCEACAEEFPHFESVMRRLRQKGEDVAYIGINVVREQDSYVLRVIEKKRYSFIALKGTEAVQGAKSGYAVRVEPTNFVIDRSGKIVYRDFGSDDPEGESLLQRMIESVLEART